MIIQTSFKFFINYTLTNSPKITAKKISNIGFFFNFNPTIQKTASNTNAFKEIKSKNLCVVLNNSIFKTVYILSTYKGIGSLYAIGDVPDFLLKNSKNSMV